MIFGGYCLDMFIMLVSSDVAFRARKPVVLVFGTALFVARAGSLLGTLAGEALANMQASTVGVAFACIACLVVAGTLLFSSSELDRMYRVHVEPSADSLYEEKCAAIAAACGLTARELEVLGLLARGRSAPFIADELCIALGTAKNHVSSIYRKVGVRDRQSLHNMIERESLR